MINSLDDTIHDDYLDALQTLDEVDEEAVLHNGVQKIYDLMHYEAIFESPIDIDLNISTKLELPQLQWHHMDLLPKKVKITNTGHTVILSAKWLQERPYISGGPFIGNYVFSQLHFHWGRNNMEGSEHSISGMKLPLEMHAVFFKSCYLTQESSLRKKDGMTVVAFMFKLQDEPNPAIRILSDAMYHIREPHNSTRLKTYPLLAFIKPFVDDYFLYNGSVNTTTCIHHIVWLISREPMGVSVGQVDLFRTLLDTNFEPLYSNFRLIQPLNDRIMYHINPSGYQHTTLLLLQKEIDSRTGNRPQQVNKYPTSSKEYISNTGTTIYREATFSNPFRNMYSILMDENQKRMY